MKLLFSMMFMAVGLVMLFVMPCDDAPLASWIWTMAWSKTIALVALYVGFNADNLIEDLKLFLGDEED